jgi:hypothetical protein
VRLYEATHLSFDGRDESRGYTPGGFPASRLLDD